MSDDVHRFGSHCNRWRKPIISIFLIFLRKVSESSFRCKFISFASCAHAYETWKQCQWIMRTLTCKHKIWGENWLYLRPYLKAFPVFNVLETCRGYLLMIDLKIVKFIKKIIERFFEKCKTCKHGPNYVQNLYQKQLNICKLIKFLSLTIARSNFHLFLYEVFNGIKPIWYEATFPKLISFLKY